MPKIESLHTWVVTRNRSRMWLHTDGTPAALGLDPPLCGHSRIGSMSYGSLAEKELKAN